MAEQADDNRQVGGSSPSPRTRRAGSSGDQNASLRSWKSVVRIHLGSLFRAGSGKVWLGLFGQGVVGQARRSLEGPALKGFTLHSPLRIAMERVEELEAAIRRHRDARGDNRCWMDDEALYRVLPEGFTPPERDTAVEIERCLQFLLARKNPATAYVSPQAEIDALQQLLKRYLDNHCSNADAEGMSALCECKLCLETRAQLGMNAPTSG